MKKLTTEPSKANIAAALQILREAPNRLAAATQGKSDEELQQPFAEGERSAVEVLAHIVNSEARTSEAIYLALLTNEPLLVDVHSQRDWGKLVRHDLIPFSELLVYFSLRRRVMLSVLHSLKESQWLRVVREENKQRKESVYLMARSLALHDLDHVEEIERNVGGQ